MKKLFLVLICSLSSLWVQCFAQNTVTIPDANFVNYLQQNFPACMAGNLLDTTCTAVVNSVGISLYGKNIQDFEGLQYFDSLQTLDISNNPATQLNVLPRRLKLLTANDIPLTALPILPTTLERLQMRTNNLTALPNLPPSLWELRVEVNHLVSLPTLPNSLTFLSLQYNSLTSLPTLPAGLTFLDVSVNQLSTVPTLPVGLTGLNIAINLIPNLPALPNLLQNLDVSNNLLTSLPAVLPPNLLQFHCGYNQISTLPPLPGGITNFSCGSNLLTVIPALPPALTYLACHQNQLTSLPALPSTLQFLLCYDNALTSLPTLPTQLINISCQNNAITCFPTLPPALVLILFPNPATCLPNYVAGMNPAHLAYPLCVVGDTMINPNGCLDGTGIYGAAYNDANANCLLGVGETRHPNLPFKLYATNGNLLQQTFSTYTGNYYLNAANDTFTVKADTAGIHYLAINCPGGDMRSVVLDTIHTWESDVDFDFACNGSVDLGVQSIAIGGMTFPGRQFNFSVAAGDLSAWYGFDCGAGISGQIAVTVSGPVSFAAFPGWASTPAVSGNTYTYAVADFGTWPITGQIGIDFLTDTTAQAGDTICISVVVTSTGNDVALSNNTVQQCYYVVNSLDPNYKEVTPVDVPAGYVDPFTYTIHFQNNGTAPALYVELVDTLDANLDLATFEVSAFSHANQAIVNGNVLTVKFPNIHLADSATNYAASQGYFQYRVQPIPGLDATNVIRNRAAIYFDFNAPILTNTTENHFNVQVSADEQHALRQLQVYPNPSNGKFIVRAAANAKPTPLKVSNLLGHTCWEGMMIGGEAALNLEAMPSGIYMLTMQGHSPMRLIKQ